MFVFVYKIKITYIKNDGIKDYKYIKYTSNKLIDVNYVLVKALINFIETMDEKWIFNSIEFLGIESEKI